jgi:hypothetical protein
VVDDVDVGADDERMLLEPEPHIPDVPDVSSIPEDVEVTGDVNVPAFDGVGTPGIGRVPGSTELAGAEAPGVVPPPSNIALDPYIPEGEVAVVEHAVPVLVAGMDMVPARPVGAGLTPADVISVEPNGIPVGELVEPIVIPSGEVTPIVGAGMTVSSICAIAALQTISAGKTAAIRAIAVVLLVKHVSPILERVNNPARDFAISTGRSACCDVAEPVSIGFATGSPRAESFDIGQSPILQSMLTLEAVDLPTCLVNFECNRSLSCASGPQTSPATKWQIAKSRSTKYGFKLVGVRCDRSSAVDCAWDA